MRYLTVFKKTYSVSKMYPRKIPFWVGDRQVGGAEDLFSRSCRFISSIERWGVAEDMMIANCLTL